MRHRKIELVRGAWAAVAVLAPQVVLRGAGGDPRDHPSVVVMRGAGTRQAGQAVLSGLVPTAPVLAMGMWVDVVHSLSGVALATARHRYARPALTDALTPAAWAAAGFHDLRNDQRSSGEELRSRLARGVLSVVPGGRCWLAQR